MEKRQAPKSLSMEARRIWNEVVESFEMISSDWPLLTLALTSWDEMQTIKAKIEKDGFILSDGKRKKAHPGIAALKESRLVFLRSWKLLGFPTAPGDDEKVDHRGYGRPSSLVKRKRDNEEV